MNPCPVSDRCWHFQSRIGNIILFTIPRSKKKKKKKKAKHMKTAVESRLDNSESARAYKNPGLQSPCLSVGSQFSIATSKMDLALKKNILECYDESLNGCVVSCLSCKRRRRPKDEESVFVSKVDCRQPPSCGTLSALMRAALNSDDGIKTD